MRVVVAVLETMWGWRDYRNPAMAAPRYFKINPKNRSGQRLHRLLGSHSQNLWVTNVCRELVCSAKHHGKPDTEWLTQNLTRLSPADLILVCGKVAQRTFQESGFKSKGKVLHIPHPAARNWTKAQLRKTERLIQNILKGGQRA